MPSLRADAIGLLALAGPQAHEALFKQLIDPHEPDQVQAAAVRAFGKSQRRRYRQILVVELARAHPRRPHRSRRRHVPRTRPRPGCWWPRSRRRRATVDALSFSSRRRLIMNNDPCYPRRGAAAARTRAPASARKSSNATKLHSTVPADAARGREVFKSICVKCHRFAGLGVQVGPDLATVQNQPKQALLEDILMPNKTIAQGYEAYVVETTGGTSRWRARRADAHHHRLAP